MPTQNQLFMRQAKTQLAGNWGQAALGTLVYLAIMGVASVSYIGELVIQGPMTVGYLIYMIVLSDYRHPDLNNLFKGFDRFLQTFVAGLLVSLAVGFGTMLLVVPGIIVALGFSMTFFIMIDYPEIPGVDAIQASWKMMDGHKWELFCLSCRFIGWGLLSILTLGILWLWLAPYMTVSYLNFYRDLKTKTPPVFNPYLR